MTTELSLTGLRTLIVGSGSIAVRHAEVLRDLGVLKMYVFSRSRRELKIEGVEIISLGEAEIPMVRFDLTVICSKTQNHFLDLLLVAKYSEVILIEKPLAGSLEDLEHLDNLGSETPILAHTYVSFPLRFMEGFAEYRKWVRKIALKDAKITSVCDSWLPDWRPGRDLHEGYWAQPGSGGVLLELIHEFDYLSALLGSLKILDVSDLSRNSLGLGVPEAIAARAIGPNGERLNIKLDFSSSQSSRFSSYSAENTFGKWDLLENTIETVEAGNSITRLFPSDFDRNKLFRKQYEEIFAPGTHPISACSFEDALSLNQAILKAWVAR